MVNIFNAIIATFPLMIHVFMWLHSGFFIFSIDYSIAYFVFLFAGCCFIAGCILFYGLFAHSPLFATLLICGFELPLINNLCLFLRWMRPAESISRRFFIICCVCAVFRFGNSFAMSGWWTLLENVKEKNDIGQLNCLHVSFFISFCECCSMLTFFWFL